MSAAAGRGGAWGAGGPQRARLLRYAATSLVVTLLTSGAHRIPALQHFEQVFQDAATSTFRRPESGRVRVVAITEDEFRDPALFGGRSPLSPAHLDSLVRGVAAQEPAVLVLDVLVHPRPYEPPDEAQARAVLLQTLVEIARRRPVIVAAPAVRELESPGVDPRMRAIWERDFVASRPAPGAPGIRCADPRFEGGLVRGIPELGDLGLPSVATAALAALGEGAHASHSGASGHGVAPLTFSGRFRSADRRPTGEWFPARVILGTRPDAAGEQLLTRAIVVVGGDYPEGRDDQLTVLGAMPGVSLWAEAIDDRLSGHGMRMPPPAVPLFVEFALGVLTGFVLLRFGAWRGLLAMVALLGLAQVGALWLYGVSFLWFSFVPASVGVIVHRELDLHDHVRKLERRLAALPGHEPPH